MNRKVALDFLELPEDASDEEVRQRLKERTDYFEQMSEESPSDFLRRINKQKLTRVQQIQKEFVQWAPGTDPADNALVSDDDFVMPDVEEEVPADTIILSYASAKPGSKENRPLSPPGWLITHTEEKPLKVFPLSTGDNYIGRKASTSLKPFIVIDDDDYLSRVHAVVQVTEGDPFQFYLDDAGSVKNEKPSRNGTYLNGDKSRISERTILNEDDVIQVGLTKLVVKYNKEGSDIEKISREVAERDYIDTVVID